MGEKQEVPSDRKISFKEEIEERKVPLDKNGDVENELLLLERISKKEATSRAVTLEILGDIKDADFKPPENVLFICKLNSITRDDDLETLFARFGVIHSCEIIRDWKTGDSLQYGFIEFETKESAQNAYFKMQDCLIDDRRIHVDFCQSVGHEWKRYQQRKRRAAMGLVPEEDNDRPRRDKKKHVPTTGLPSSMLHRKKRSSYNKNNNRNDYNEGHSKTSSRKRSRSPRTSSSSYNRSR